MTFSAQPPLKQTLKSQNINKFYPQLVSTTAPSSNELYSVLNSTTTTASSSSGGRYSNYDIIPSLLQPIPTQALMTAKDKNPFLNDDDPPSLLPPLSSMPIQPLLPNQQQPKQLYNNQQQQQYQPPLPPLPVSYQKISAANSQNISGEFQLTQSAVGKSHASPAPVKPPRPSAPRPNRPPPPNVSASASLVPFVADFSGIEAAAGTLSGGKPIKSAFNDLEDTMRASLGSPAKGLGGSVYGGGNSSDSSGQSMFVTSAGFGGSGQQQQQPSHVQQSFVLGLV